jgi:NAD(P)-dependent dehydrogenase (short-subunit alcohol dehydrogenase family)
MDFRLDGKRALVSGAGRGLGRAIADGLAELGAEVIGTSRDPAQARHIAERYGTAPTTLDVTDIASYPDIVKNAWPIDILVNNAGVNVPQSVLDVDESSWDLVLDTNLKGAFFLTQAVVRKMRAEGRAGSIINIGSQAGEVGIEERSAYCASKAGLHQITKVMALELARENIRVNAVAPTFVLTDLTKVTLNNPEWRARVLDRIPAGRFAEPEDVVGAVAFLAGPTAAMVTGHVLLVDGGWTAR